MSSKQSPVQSPVITKILKNFEEIGEKYSRMEKANKMFEYIQECRSKLKARQREDLVLELNQALHNRLEYAKKKAADTDKRVHSYLRGQGARSVSDDSIKRSGGDSSTDTPSSESGVLL